MSEETTDDVMERRFACLGCNSKMRAAVLIVADRLRCPHCNSPDLQQIDREPVTLDEYHGEIGTKQ